MKGITSDSRITRRQFVATAGAAAAGLALSKAGVQSQNTHPSRPNILFVIADDWMFPHAGAYGDRVVKTPNFDRVARSGALFNNSICAAPTCSASRAGILTGQAIHRLDEGANLYGFLPSRFRVYPDVLEEAGYSVGFTSKGWGPGTLDNSGRTRNPAGPLFVSFDEFLKQSPSDKPFCFWHGSNNPHRNYKPGSGVESGIKLSDVKVPPFLPDTKAVRSDIADYYLEVQQFDAELGKALESLEASGKAGNTLVVVTSDNGMPFPRSKANLYGSGTHMPLAIRWPDKVKAGTRVNTPVSHTDLAPTFLEAVGLAAPPDITGRSLMPLLTGSGTFDRKMVFTERERHTNCRKGNSSYPSRAMRTADFLYIRNFWPNLWPAGDPEMFSSLGDFGDIDPGPTKSQLMNRRNNPEIKPYFERATAKRPAEELYDLRKDPWELKNVASDRAYESVRKQMSDDLESWMKQTADPRALDPNDQRYNGYAYVGRLARWQPPKPKK